MKYKISDVSNFQKGFAFKSKDFQTSGVKIVRVGNLNKNDYSDENCLFIDPDKASLYKKYELLLNDIIISTVGSWPNNPASVVGKVSIIPENINGSLLNQNAVRIRGNGKIDQRYLGYVLLGKDFKSYIVGTAQGSASQASITLNDISNFEIELPDLLIQKKIVNILSNIDEKIKLNNKINDNLYVQSLSIVSNYLKNAFVESKYLIDIATVKYGKGLPKNNLIDDGYPVFGGNGIIGYYSKYLYEEPQILISCRGAASGSIIESLPYSYVTSNSLIIELKDYFYFNFIKNYLFANQLHSYATGSAQPQITIDNLKNVMIPYPNKNEIEDIARVLDDYALKAQNIYYENKKLISLRDTLLPKLMSGEIDVSNIKLDV